MRRGAWIVEVSQTATPEGQPALLLQFEHGYLVSESAEDWETLADAIGAGAKELRERQA